MEVDTFSQQLLQLTEPGARKQFNINHYALSKIVQRKEKVIFKPSPSVLPCMSCLGRTMAHNYN